MNNESRDSVGKIPSPSITKVIVRATELDNKNAYVLQIRASLCYKLWQLCFIQIRANVVVNGGSYYKLGQTLLRNKEAVTYWGKMYYKLEQVLQIRAVIANWSIAGLR